MNKKISPIKELVDPEKIQAMADESTYPRPRWMLNESTSDHIWLLASNGINREFYDNNDIKSHRLNFITMATAPNERLGDKANRPLLIDIQHSILYLDVNGKITSSRTAEAIFRAAINLIYHTNERRIMDGNPLIRSLGEIKYNDLKGYLLAYGIEANVFESALEIITEKYSSIKEIDWSYIKSCMFLTKRELLSLKDKVVNYLNEHGDFCADKDQETTYKRQYKNACEKPLELDEMLLASESTISNAISSIEALYNSRAAQKYPFQHSPITLFKGGREIFDILIAKEKTALIPAHIALHTISSALGFLREYGKPLYEFIERIYDAEIDVIKSLNFANTTAYTRFNPEIRTLAFNNAPIPEKLKHLKITSWERPKNELKTLSFDKTEYGISLGLAVRLYTAAMWIAICSFVAARTTSLRTLKRNCFVQSPVDELYDIILKIPKSSERYELEDLHRPIPDLIYDYGLQFSSLACLIEDRRGLVADENDLYLFSNSISYRAISSGRLDDGAGDYLKTPLSSDYIKSCLDIFQDWCNSPLIDGKRWYCTTHQFRRFFAVLYFNFSDDQGLEELSWFMGHSNLDQTFYYAEISPNDEWIEEAENTIARIGATLNKIIHGDNTIQDIVNRARKSSTIYTVLEGLVHDLITEHKNRTGQVVRFYKIDNNEVFFYFKNNDGETDG
ncbi:hypothetical protein LA366_10990 [Aeromonas jandaei]|uniref:Site-specific integrase n=1 Tax=Aeromonas jandaei TaxID=650 RepID=A0A7T4ABE4_AERJA|nr:hypothetical protein [Aeromonas jandaei]QQB20850.1 hypothetical protein I6H43_04775 [Aeromonas jandaei]UCA31658.1 hypothetical protein LA366_10990 [Aeromonas jandaei]